jgi:hypothetical protein
MAMGRIPHNGGLYIGRWSETLRHPRVEALQYILSNPGEPEMFASPDLMLIQRLVTSVRSEAIAGWQTGSFADVAQQLVRDSGHMVEGVAARTHEDLLDGGTDTAIAPKARVYSGYVNVGQREVALGIEFR